MSEKILENLGRIVEAVIFASDEPISTDQIKFTIEDTTNAQIKTAVTELNHEYSTRNRSFHIIEIAGGFQMVTRDSYAQWIKRLYQKKNKSRLSQAALETLSVIAFKQPVSKSEISAIRGVNCDGVVKTLLERNLIAISGRDDGPGRPLLHKTTREFLRYFGINRIEDLPKPREIEELLKEESGSGNSEAGSPVSEIQTVFPTDQTAEQQSVPEPEQQSVPEPEQQSVPEPEQQSVPEPAQQSVPEPEQQSVPEPEQQSVPEPEQQSDSAGETDTDSNKNAAE